MAVDKQNPPLSTQKSDSGLHVALHPLVLLTISDYITRHTLRQQKGPIIGALLGQQNGREITVEDAFECKVVGGASASLDEEWFAVRLQQMKDVHKAPALDLVGWYTIVSKLGPQQHHVAIQTQLSRLCSEPTILLGFHTSDVLDGQAGGKLPLTIYEANIEPPETTTEAEGDVEMLDAQSSLRVTFKELPYTIETGEAEMIAVDFVARGGGNATAVQTVSKKVAPTKTKAQAAKGKNRQGVEGTDTAPDDTQNVLTREEEELIASLTAKVNAIKMLSSRIKLITTYLERLPSSYPTGDNTQDPDDTNSDHTTVNHSILRSIQALLNRLSLLIPSDTTTFEQELLSEKNDVALISLLSAVTESITSAREAGHKFAIVETARTDKSRGKLNPRDLAELRSQRIRQTDGSAGDLL